MAVDRIFTDHNLRTLVSEIMVLLGVIGHVVGGTEGSAQDRALRMERFVATSLQEAVSICEKGDVSAYFEKTHRALECLAKRLAIEAGLIDPPEGYRDGVW